MREQITKEFADSLRLVADFYDANPTLTLPIWFYAGTNRFEINLIEGEEAKVEFMRWANAFRVFKKEALDSCFKLVKQFGVIQFEVTIARKEVCEARVVGKRTVKKKVPATYKEEFVKEDIIEWDCPGSIMRLENEQRAIEILRDE